MRNQSTDLNALAKRYQGVIADLEKQLEEAKRKSGIITDAIHLLEKEGISPQDNLFTPPPIVMTDKYSSMDMGRAIIDVIRSSDEKPSGEEIYMELVKNGFKSKSKNLKRDVYTRLFRMHQRKEVSAIRKGGRKLYSLPEKV